MRALKNLKLSSLFTTLKEIYFLEKIQFHEEIQFHVFINLTVDKLELLLESFLTKWKDYCGWEVAIYCNLCILYTYLSNMNDSESKKCPNV